MCRVREVEAALWAGGELLPPAEDESEYAYGDGYAVGEDAEGDLALGGHL